MLERPLRHDTFDNDCFLFSCLAANRQNISKQTFRQPTTTVRTTCLMQHTAVLQHSNALLRLLLLLSMLLMLSKQIIARIRTQTDRQTDEHTKALTYDVCMCVYMCTWVFIQRTTRLADTQLEAATVSVGIENKII